MFVTAVFVLGANPNERPLYPWTKQGTVLSDSELAKLAMMGTLSCCASAPARAVCQACHASLDGQPTLHACQDAKHMLTSPPSTLLRLCATHVLYYRVQ